MLASLPKAPSRINPLANPRRALIRRNWVLTRMEALDYIDSQSFDISVKEPITATFKGVSSEIEADYLAEEIRRYMISKFGLSSYKEGYEVYSTIKSKNQLSANKALKQGIESYEIRHGFKKPENFIELLPETFVQRSDLFYSVSYNPEDFKDDFGIAIDLKNPFDEVLDFLSDSPNYTDFSPNIILSSGIKKISLLNKSGIIKTSFYEAALDAEIPDSVIMDFAYIFGWDVDFVFDIREGDSFYLIYETPYSGGAKIKNGDIVAAEFINNGKIYKANRFYTSSNKKEFFDDEGNNLQKAFLRAPLDFAYISSHFNPNRMHPVLHTIRAHNGTDYAAKRGSPVRTTGNGTIKYAGRRNGCGNEIVIQHTNDYSTRYCHLDKFHSGIKKGKKVLQGETIGYVGSTGLATGPHLHYEFKIGNKHIDPIKLKLPSAEPIGNNLKSDFDTLVNNNKLMLSKLKSMNPDE